MTEQAVWSVRRVSRPIRVLSLSAVRLRLWMVGPPLLLAALGVLLATHVQKPAFRATAVVSFARVPITGPLDDAKLRDTQVSIARDPDLARRVVAVAGVPGLTAPWFLRHSGAKPQSNAGILELSVSSPRAAAATRLTNAYAQEFSRFTRERDVALLNETIGPIRAQLQRLRDSGRAGTPAYDALLQTQNDLETQRTAAVLGPAGHAAKVRPHGLRNGIFGGVIGAFLGLALVVDTAERRRLNGTSRRIVA